MAIPIGGYIFDGPFPSPDSLQSRSGVYAILDPLGNGRWKVLDIGESGDLWTRVKSHDREECWNRQTSSRWQVAAFYCDAPTRMRVEKELRDRYKLPCGKQ